MAPVCVPSDFRLTAFDAALADAECLGSWARAYSQVTKNMNNNETWRKINLNMGQQKLVLHLRTSFLILSCFKNQFLRNLEMKVQNASMSKT